MDAGRVIVVADDAVLRGVLGVILSQSGYDVSLFPDAEQALARIRSQRPDVVILDLHLPRVSGLELVDDLASDPRTADVPVVAISGQRRMLDEIRSRVAAALCKPFDVDELLEHVERLVGQPSSSMA